MVLGAALVALLLFSSQTRYFPLVMAGAMLLLVLFQHFAMLPEIIFRGREADFPPGSASFAIQARVWTLGQIYVGAGGCKTGGLRHSDQLFVRILCAHQQEPEKIVVSADSEVDGYAQ